MTIYTPYGGRIHRTVNLTQSIPNNEGIYDFRFRDIIYYIYYSIYNLSAYFKLFRNI